MGIFVFFILVLVILVIIRLIQNYIYSINNYQKEYNFEGKLNENLLSENEKKYYYALKNLLKNTEYIIFCKMRMADIIKTNNYNDFNKIRGKHIDFIICDKDTKPKLFIELDDRSHNNKTNKQNDTKKDFIMKKVGIDIIRTKIYEIDKNIEYIKNKLEIEETKNI